MKQRDTAAPSGRAKLQEQAEGRRARGDREFHATLRAMEWVTDLYSLIFASLLLTGGKIGDRFGRRRVLIVGTTVFVVGLLVVGAASNLELFHFRTFSLGLLTAGLVTLGQSGMIFVLSIFLQSARGYSAIDTGLMLLPFAAPVLIAAPMAGRIASRIGPKWVVSAGMLVEVIAMYWLSRTIGMRTSPLMYVPVLLLYGCGIGTAIAQLTNLVMSEIPVEDSGAASGANSTTRRVGQTIGIAILGAMLAGGMSSSGDRALSRSQVIPPQVKAQVRQSLRQGMLGGSGPVSRQLPPQVQQAVKEITSSAMAAGARKAAFVDAILLLMGFICSLFVPNKRGQEPEDAQDGDKRAACERC